MITLKSTYEKLQGEFEKLQGANKLALEELTQIKADNAKLSEEKAALEKRIEELTKEPPVVAALEQSTKDFEEMKEATSQLIKENAELSEKIEELQSTDKNLEEMVAAKALEIASSQGVPPLSLKPVAQPSSSTLENDLVGQYNAITDSAKQREFWVEHREELVKLLKSR